MKDSSTLSEQSGFLALAEMGSDFVAVLDNDGIIIYVNAAVTAVLGYNPEEVIGLSLQSLIEAEQSVDPVRFLGASRSMLLSPELAYKHQNGSQRIFEVRVRDCRKNPDINGILLHHRDISEYKRIETAFNRANRALHVLSAGNCELIHAEDETKLLTSICEICVHQAGYIMAWVGIAIHDAKKTVQPAAQFGFEQGYLTHANITWDDSERGNGPTGKAIRTGTVQVNQNFLENPEMAPWRKDASERGYQSSIALPLIDKETYGALMIYAEEPDAFDEEEVRLLTYLADNLAYGIAVLRARVKFEKSEAEIFRLAYYDALTELPNRNCIFEKLEQYNEYTENKEDKRSRYAILTLDLVRFGDIQAGLGIRPADDILKQFAKRIQGILEGSPIARVEGDEFVILLTDAGEAEARDCFARVEKALTEPFYQASIPVRLMVRGGISISTSTGEIQGEIALLQSNLALRQAKQAGTGVELYKGPYEWENPERLTLIAELHNAIKAGQIILHYQPKIDLNKGTVNGVEALARWQHPERGLIPLDQFIRLAEQTGLIEPLTDCVLEQALQQCSLWQQQGKNIPVAVNISAVSFNDPEFPVRVDELLKKCQVSPEMLQLEMTESVLMKEPVRSNDLLFQFKHKGIKVMIDDFGTGYSSLKYIESLPVHALKIDRSFVTQIPDSLRTCTILEATITMARSLGMRTIAEGVDSKDQLEKLRAMGCLEVQGYYFSKPLSAEACWQWCKEFSKDRFFS